MPRMTRVDEHLTTAKSARTDFNRRFKTANVIRSKSDTLLDPDKLSGDWDGTRLLTSLGGEIRQLTYEDLEHFRTMRKNLKTRFKGGVTAQALIDKSLKSDRDRAKTQIREAVPTSSKAGVIMFQVNAGPDSNVTRHYIHVELMKFADAISDPRPSKKVAKELLLANCKWDCDCGRHRYWYRYIFTTLGANYSFAETAYPKIRNPALRGSCCKHILRVAHQMISSPTTEFYVTRMIDYYRREVEGRRVDHAKKDIKEIGKMLREEDDSTKSIKTKAQRNKATPAGKALIKMVAEKKAPPPRSPAIKKAQDKKSAQLLADLKQLPPEQLAALLAQLK